MCSNNLKCRLYVLCDPHATTTLHPPTPNSPNLALPQDSYNPSPIAPIANAMTKPSTCLFATLYQHYLFPEHTLVLLLKMSFILKSKSHLCYFFFYLAFEFLKILLGQTFSTWLVFLLENSDVWSVIEPESLLIYLTLLVL